ncbi:MAG: hypothetical protein ACFFCW_41005 [Candidatus Hodarchaeota archaeon]
MSPEERGLTYRSALSSHCSSLSLSIADITIALISDDPKLKMRAEGVMKHFMANEGEPDIEIKARWGNLRRQSDRTKVFDSGALWQLYSDNGSYIFQFNSPALGALPYKVASFNRDFTNGEVSINRSYFDLDQHIYPLEYPLDELLLVNYLAQGKGVEIHACGVVDSPGRGHLFVGQSGAGKSTMAKMWEDEPGITILSDDRIILRKFENKIWMYGTPWHGEAMLASPGRVPVKAIYFLEKDKRNELFSQAPTNSISRLFTCSFPPFYNPDALIFTLRFLEEVVKNVPTYELRFKPEKSVVEFIKGASQ